MFQYAYARERELLYGEKFFYDLHFFQSSQRKRKLKKVAHLHLYLADFNVRLPSISIVGAMFFQIVQNVLFRLSTWRISQNSSPNY